MNLLKSYLKKYNNENKKTTWINSMKKTISTIISITLQKIIKKIKKITKNYCKIKKVILQFTWSGEKWYKVVEKMKRGEDHC